MSTVYTINKGVNKPVEFKGLKAQYIWWLGGGLIGILILFAILYIIGVNTYVALGFALGGAALVIVYVFRMSNTYGEHGMMKKIASRSVPKVIKVRSRRIFQNLPSTVNSKN
ncbi:MAG: hypothetical protein BGO55_06180 [Sphingobacteriales bacterium 50-39]|nr:DUF4133 domain-containing protein [Sphingobacteriales bacterium]OJW52851.1 MAG: hypothetical protein BGO55_06180 [Sphingobacteriales bacterium 50-39]